MAGEAIITSGTFTQPAAAIPQVLDLVFAPDWIKVWNITSATTPTANNGFMYEWNALWANNGGFISRYGLTAALVNAPTTIWTNNIGIRYVDPLTNPVTSPIQYTAAAGVSGATPPVVTFTAGQIATLGPVGATITVRATAFNNPLQAGSLQLAGLDFTATITAATTLTLNFMPPIVANAVANAIGLQLINGPQNPTGFYPRNRYITAMATVAANPALTRITFSVTHAYQPGEAIRIYVPEIPTPAPYGITGFGSGVTGTVVATGNADVNGYTNTVDVNINTAALPAFVFPLTAAAQNINFQWAYAVPYGEDTAGAAAIQVPPGQPPLFGGILTLGDALFDSSFRGIILSPQAARLAAGGAAGDTVVWMAGTAGLPND